MTHGDPDAAVCRIKTHPCSSLAGQNVLLVVVVGKGSICEVFVLWLLATGTQDVPEAFLTFIL